MANPYYPISPDGTKSNVAKPHPIPWNAPSSNQIWKAQEAARQARINWNPMQYTNYPGTNGTRMPKPRGK